MLMLRDDGWGRGSSGGEAVGFEAISGMNIHFFVSKKVLLAFGG